MSGAVDVDRRDLCESTEHSVDGGVDLGPVVGRLGVVGVVLLGRGGRHGGEDDQRSSSTVVPHAPRATASLNLEQFQRKMPKI